MESKTLLTPPPSEHVQKFIRFGRLTLPYIPYILCNVGGSLDFNLSCRDVGGSLDFDLSCRDVGGSLDFDLFYRHVGRSLDFDLFCGM